MEKLRKIIGAFTSKPKQIEVVYRQHGLHNEMDEAMDKVISGDYPGIRIAVSVKENALMSDQVHKSIGTSFELPFLFCGYLYDGMIYIRFTDNIIHGHPSLFGWREDKILRS